MFLVCGDSMQYLGSHGPYSLSFSEWNSMSEKFVLSTLKNPSACFEVEPKEWKVQLDLNDAQVERIQRLLTRGAHLSMEIERLSCEAQCKK